MSYKVSFLNDEDFENLPYPDMDTSLGVADPKTKRAYVRRTGIKPLDLYNAAHELEHLEDGQKGEHADHYKHGVYYKNLGQVLDPVAMAASFVPGPWQAPAAVYSAGKGAYNLTKSLQGPPQPEQSAPGGMGQFQIPQEAPAPAGSMNPAQGSTTPNVISTTSPGPEGQSGISGGVVSNLRNFLGQQNAESRYGFYSGRES